MTTQEINRAYERIIGSLDNKELKDAFVCLQGMIAGVREYVFQEKFDELQSTYKYMLRYRMEGAKDPMQEHIYHTLLLSAYELADQVKHKALSAESSFIYYNRKRSLDAGGGTTYDQLHAQLDIPGQTMELEQQYEITLTELFHKIWVSYPLSPDDVLVVKEILYNPVLPVATGCQIVSALLLGLQASFDKEKLFLLFDALETENEEVRVRALIGILLTLFAYRKRTYLYPQIQERLDLYAESHPAFTNDIRTITLRFILARETEKITRKLQEEIIPEMMKLNSKITGKINLKDLASEQIGAEMNPEWQEMLAGSSLEKKMQEFGELQQEGADVMHSTFIHLKNFPFFREISNWFLPFIPQHSSLGNPENKEPGDRQVLDALATAPFMCNSDKYSLYFSMMQLPEQHKKMMMGQFEGQAGEMIQQSKEEFVTQRGNIAFISGQYIQDLYRFFKLYPSKLDFDDIFTWKLDFHNLPILQPYISDKESMWAIAEYYLHKGHFLDALSIYVRLSIQDHENDVLFQKIGYCKQMNDDIEGALDAYLRADLLNNNSKWVIRRIAGCYRTLKRPEEALTYYQRYELMSPDELSVQMNIGHCYLEMRDYDEALKYYFKVDYLDTKSNKAWRPIAWCSFLTGKYDQARNYYKRILDAQPNMHDYMNAGHTEWVMQNVKQALKYYKKSVETEQNDFHKFKEQFNQDIPDLLMAGIEEPEIPLMLDQLRYVLEDGL
ncbi:tetratricopeptide repeat protein [Parabacteroides sp. PF5-9]|uniref:tetratricopeptide repeat protein n=1 Tax=Parabacteroides sp. PF5-9 TaxID=1742404 RepID=UPI0024734344|nr:tetratricopeptide repeat protein [Parabacteroides sp. PF5-9]MDH6359269.1 tetratricopeptide (TPR) repeat protein [Parabacteroides sp. PF5-9]